MALRYQTGNWSIRHSVFQKKRDPIQLIAAKGLQGKPWRKSSHPAEMLRV